MEIDTEENDCSLFGPQDDGSEDPPVTDPGCDVDSKRALISPNTKQYDALVDKIRHLIVKGHGETLYDIGDGEDDDDKSALSEEDLNASVATLQSISMQLDCELNHLRDKGPVKEYLIREKKPDEDFTDVRVAVVGNVDAGKSTLLGVLTHNMLDDGRGKARLKLLRHKHEAETGRTSSIGNDILGFDSKGDVVNKPDAHTGAIDRPTICQQASKIVTFIDLAGHEKYLKTTVTGMTGQMPDFCMLMVGSNAGVVGMTKEHLGLALALNVPVFVVVTKIDMCPENIRQETMQLLCRILKSPGCRKIPVLLTSHDDVVVTAKNFTSERVCPIFQVSNVTGENIALLKSFLNLLSVRLHYKENEPMLYQIDGTYIVPNVGTTVSGTMLQGSANINDIVHLGPDKIGKFQSVSLKSIHRKMRLVDSVRAGQTASFALKKVKRTDVRKGMILASPLLEARSVWEFDADVLILHHATTMSTGYQAMVHCGCTRQTATIISMDQPHLRTGDRASCRFRFIKQPEYIPDSTKIIFREGRTKAIGTVTKLHFDVEGRSTNNIRKMKKQERFNRRPEAAV